MAKIGSVLHTVQFNLSATGNSVESLFLLIGGVAIGVLTLLIIKLLADYRQLLSAKVLVLLILCSQSYVITQFLPQSSIFSLPLNLLGASVPPLFWLFTLTFFQSTSTWKGISPTYRILFFSCIALNFAACMQHNGNSNPVVTDLYYIGFVLKNLFVVMALFEVIRNWRSDLVECRRKFRLGIIGTVGLFLLFAITTEFIYAAQTIPRHISFINISMIAFLSILKAYWILIANPTALLEAIDSVPAELSEKLPKRDETISVADQAWLNTLVNCMVNEGYYRNNELTIRSLSDHINIPEHHLRRLINQHLGFRNFNEYLNKFRIEEASLRLSDPNQARLPITTIAIESGYGSLTTFNKAFKALMEMTPSEYRKSH
jgi:AraC-like DNA-binding protein